MQKIG